MQTLGIKVKDGDILAIEVFETNFYNGSICATAMPSLDIYNGVAKGDIEKVVLAGTFCRVVISYDRFVSLENKNK